MRLKLIFYAAALSATVSCSSNLTPSSEITEQKFDFNSDITALTVHDQMNIVFDSSVPKGEIVIRANSDLHRYVFVHNHGESVEIWYDDGKKSYDGMTLEAHVPSEQFTEVSAYDLVTITGRPGTEDFSVSLDDSSEMFSDNVNFNTLTVYLDGLAEMVLSGKCNILDITSTGMSEFICPDLYCEHVKGNLYDMSDVTVTSPNGFDGNIDDSTLTILKPDQGQE